MYKLLISFLLSCTLFLVTDAFAVYFEFYEPGYEETVLREEVDNGDSILVNINTVSLDNQGNLYYLKSDLESVTEEDDAHTWEEMNEIEYSVTLASISLDGEENILAEARLPLKKTVVGMLFDWRLRRLLIFLETLAVSEDCLPFLSSALSGEGLVEPGELRPSSQESERKDWNWSGLENCFHEKLSIIEITGFMALTPF